MIRHLLAAGIGFIESHLVPKLLNKFPSLVNQTSLEDGLKATINWYKVGNKDFDENEN